ncbi:hypothetical protein EXIGLDRAFT_731282 [Exidia glandulosa HHB12029]|uniref:CFEM domain-containing protein n=1 Tax=Exidia glandulosa HHB12029 TaxID=1314781 RepID=A0A165L3K9_EXIGL|nr:hypothetical protein EXIGLDRAFT_731282 [Exidia glandulosa HHB12029]
MRYSALPLFVAALTATFVAAQNGNGTVTASAPAAGDTTLSTDAPTCIFSCSRSAALNHVGAAKSCIANVHDDSDLNEATECICQSSELSSAISQCLQEKCPAVGPAEYKHECDVAKGSASKVAGIAGSLVVASGSLFLSILFL